MKQDEMIQYIHQLIAEVCSYPKDSLERKKKLTEIISLMQSSGLISGRGQLNQFDYEDVLSNTWLYFCRNLDRFDAERANIFTWFNIYLRFRIRDRLEEINSGKKLIIEPQTDPETGRLFDPIDHLPDVSHSCLLINEIRQWLEDDRTTLARIHLRNNPKANAYTIIQHRCIYDTSWQALSQQLNENRPTLSNFYRRKCLPLLIRWFNE